MDDRIYDAEPHGVAGAISEAVCHDELIAGLRATVALLDARVRACEIALERVMREPRGSRLRWAERYAQHGENNPPRDDGA